MAVGLIGMDIDGTLLNEERRVTEHTKEVLRFAAGKGVALSFCTGRCMSEMGELIRELPCVRYAVSANGAYTVDLQTGELLESDPMPAESARAARRALKDYETLFDLFLSDRILTDEDCLRHLERYELGFLTEQVLKTRSGVKDFDAMLAAREEPVGKLNIYFASREKRDEALSVVKELPYELSYQDGASIELNAPGVHKGKGLLHLSARLGLDPAEVMALGDNLNDVAMLRAAGVSVAMGNAAPGARAAARYATQSNRDEGLARAILRYI